MAEAESVDFDLASMTASVQCSRNKFGDVQFRGEVETYNIGVDVICMVTMGPTLVATDKDWVGLFKVGWRSPRDHLCFERITIPRDYSKGKEVDSRLVFPASKLPGDDGEFYQFCYVTYNGDIRGASSPFQFRKSISFSSSLDDLIEVEEEFGELLIVKSRASHLDEQLKKANDKCNQLKQDIDLVQSEKELLVLSQQEVARKLEQAKDEANSLKQQLTNEKSISADHVKQIDSLKQTIAHQTEQNAALSEAKTALGLSIKELQETEKQLKNEKDALLGQVTSLQAEKALYQSHFTSSETALQSHMECNEQLSLELADERTSKQQISSQLENSEKQLEQQLQEIQRLLTELDSSKENSAVLEARLLSAEEKLVLNEKQAEELTEKLQLQNEHCQKITSELQEKEALYRKLQDELNEAANESAMCALQAAHTTLKQRYFRIERQFNQQKSLIERLTVQLHESEQQCDEERQQVKALKERLVMGQELFKEKYVEIQKLQEQLDKKQKSPAHSGMSRVPADVGSVSLELGEQMGEMSRELERRSQQIQEKQLQAEVCEAQMAEMKAELNVLRDVLAAVVRGPSTEASSATRVTVDLQPILDSPTLSQYVHNLRHQEPDHSQSVVNLYPALPDGAQPAASIERPPESIGVLMSSCPVCNVQFTSDAPKHSRTEHIDEHYTSNCPVCQQPFSSQQLEQHVQTHFQTE